MKRTPLYTTYCKTLVQYFNYNTPCLYLFSSTTQNLSFEIMCMVIVGDPPPPPIIMYRYIKKTTCNLIPQIFTNSHTKFKQSRIKEIRKINSYNKTLTQSCIRITAMHIFQRGPKPGAGKNISKADSIFYIQLNQTFSLKKKYIYVCVYIYNLPG